jgi:hypothetical protein
MADRRRHYQHGGDAVGVLCLELWQSRDCGTVGQFQSGAHLAFNGDISQGPRSAFVAGYYWCVADGGGNDSRSDRRVGRGRTVTNDRKFDTSQ